VRVVVGGDRADHGQLLGDAGRAGKQLAKLNARHVGADRLERAADFGRCVRLGVERLVLRRTTTQIQEDHALGAAERLVGRQHAERNIFAPFEQPRQREP